MASPRPERVFVYGTLLEEEQLRAVVGSLRWRRLGAANFPGVLYDVGAFPALQPSSDPVDLVPGMVLEFADGATALARLDDYEGTASGLYVRQHGQAKLAEGRPVEVWVYVYNRRVEGLRRIDRWPSA